MREFTGNGGRSAEGCQRRILQCPAASRHLHLKSLATTGYIRLNRRTPNVSVTKPLPATYQVIDRNTFGKHTATLAIGHPWVHFVDSLTHQTFRGTHA